MLPVAGAGIIYNGVLEDRPQRLDIFVYASKLTARLAGISNAAPLAVSQTGCRLFLTPSEVHSEGRERG